ncbi:MAG TPA: OmpW family outer membrane protein [Thermoanaerobaculia bacterium]|nr:OmpW family outer membrane protein [Thermoanaerobaculia bacterium]
MKKMKWLLVAMLFTALPLCAQDRKTTISLFVSQVSMDGGELDDAFETELEDGNGFGLAGYVPFNRWLGVEGAIFSLRNEARLVFEGAAPFELGRADLVPITVGVQAHLTGGMRFDPYVGAGAAYVTASDLYSEDLDIVGIGRIDIESEFTYFVNAGLAFDFNEHFGIAVDGRYIPFEPSTQAAAGDEVELDLTPTILSAALRFRF